MSDNWTVFSLLNWTTQYFRERKSEWPHLEAEILLAHSLNLKRIQLYIQYERTLTKEELAVYKECIKRRSQHEPIAYITGTQPFMGLDFKVDKNVLIPRPETEKLVEIAIELVKTSSPLSLGPYDPTTLRPYDPMTLQPYDPTTLRPYDPMPLRPYDPYTVADIGTGSGAIGISLAKYLPQARVIATDFSSLAIEIAQINAHLHQVTERCQFLLGDMFAPLKGREAVDCIISNPPYIPTCEIPTLMADVRDFEPHAALSGGEDGLDYIKILIEESSHYLKENGSLIFEFGEKQAAAIKILAKEHFKEIAIHPDHTGTERVFVGKYA